jgi:hypothetical protein
MADRSNFLEAVELPIRAVEKLVLHLAAYLSYDIEEDSIGELDLWLCSTSRVLL